MNHPSAGSSGEPPIGSPILGPAIPPRSSSDAPPAKPIDGDLGPFVSGDGIPSVLPPAPQPTRAEATEIETPDEELPWLVSSEESGEREANSLDTIEIDRPPREDSSPDDAAAEDTSTGDAEFGSFERPGAGDEEHATDTSQENTGGVEPEVDWYLSRPAEGDGVDEAPLAALDSADETSGDGSPPFEGDAPAEPDSSWQPWAGTSAPLTPDAIGEASDQADADRESGSSLSQSWEQTDEPVAEAPAEESAAEPWWRRAEFTGANGDTGAEDPWGEQAVVEGANGSAGTHEAERQQDDTGETTFDTGTEDAWEQGGDAGKTALDSTAEDAWGQGGETDDTAIDATVEDVPDQRETNGALPGWTSSGVLGEPQSNERIAVPISNREIPDVSDAVLEEIASRLERIARSLRARDGGELSGDVSDPLEILITGYALGYSEGVRRSEEDESHES
jgi:hypothetical protein